MGWLRISVISPVRTPLPKRLHSFLCIGYCACVLRQDDPRVLRALGSSIRQDILRELASCPATSAMLARQLGSNTGVMSYQLRELAKAGLIQTDREEGRARYWRLARIDFRFDDPAVSPHPALAQAAIDQRLSQFTGALANYLYRRDLSARWRDAALFSESAVHLRAAELAEFSEEYLALLARWRDRAGETTRRGTRSVRLALFAFPDDTPRRADNDDNVD